MSYPVRRCPVCGHDVEYPDVPTVDTAIEKEKEIWRPWDCVVPAIDELGDFPWEYSSGNSWTESPDSTTIDTSDYEKEVI